MAYPLEAAQPVLASVDGWPIHLPDLKTALARIIERARERSGFTVFTLNLDHLVKLRANRAFRDVYARADLVTADGAPIAWLSRFQQAGIERTTGADMFIPLAMAAAKQRLPVYIFGSTMPVLTTAAETLRKASGGTIEFAGLTSPSANFDPCGAEADAAIEIIKASGAAICFVTLGAPKQEIFSARAVEKGCGAGFICVGAAADFIAKTQVRAPQVFQQYGLEWAWRLGNNPRRLGMRYAACAAVLFDVVFVAPLRQRVVRREI